MKRKAPGSDLGKDLADRASRSPLLANFLATSSSELMGLPADIIVNEIILRSLPRFVQLMLINKTLRTEIESVPNLYHNLFKYHYKELYIRLHHYVSNGGFYNTFFSDIPNRLWWLGGDSDYRGDGLEVIDGFVTLFGLKEFEMPINILQLMALILPKQATDMILWNLDKIIGKDANPETALFANRIFALVFPFAIPPVSYYMESHAYFINDIVIPLLNMMGDTINPKLSPDAEPIYVFITHMTKLTLRNKEIFSLQHNKYANSKTGHMREELNETLSMCTEVNPLYVLGYLKKMIGKLGFTMDSQLRKFIENTTFPRLNALINDSMKKTTYFIDTIKRDEFGPLLIGSFVPYESALYDENYDATHWTDELTEIKKRLVQIRAYTFNKESMDAIEKAELALSYAKKDGIKKWIKNDTDNDVKEKDLFKRLFYCALKKSGVNFSSIVRASSSSFDGYCHACPMKAIYEEEGVNEPRFFCSTDCLAMTIETQLSI